MQPYPEIAGVETPLLQMSPYSPLCLLYMAIISAELQCFLFILPTRMTAECQHGNLHDPSTLQLMSGQSAAHSKSVVARCHFYLCSSLLTHATSVVVKVVHAEKTKIAHFFPHEVFSSFVLAGGVGSGVFMTVFAPLTTFSLLL